MVQCVVGRVFVCSIVARVCLIVGVLACWRVGVLVCWFVDVLVVWCVCMLVCVYVGLVVCLCLCVCAWLLVFGRSFVLLPVVSFHLICPTCG